MRNALRNGAAAWVMTVAAATLSIGVPAAFAAPTSESTRYVDEAKALSGKGDLNAAIIQLKNAVRADADNSEARYQLALLYLRTGDPGAAQRELESARARGFDDGKIVVPLSQAYFQQGRFQDVVKGFDPEKYTGETRSEVLIAKARAHTALGETDAARALVTKALTETPNSSAVLGADALLLRNTGKLTEADAQIDKAIAKDPEHVEYLVLKGEIRQQMGDAKEAQALFDKAVEKAPRYSRARVARAILNLSNAKFDAVEPDVNAVLTAEPRNPLGLYLRAFLLAKAGKFKDTMEILTGLPQLVDGYPPARYLLAATAFASGNLETAASNADIYVTKVPDDANGAKLLASISMRKGDPTRAVQLLEPLKGKLADDKAFKLQLAEAYLGVGRSEEAITLFREGAEADPNNEAVQLALAVSQIRTGATDKGVAELEKIINAKPASQQANGALILTLLQTGQTAKALEAANALVKADPNGANGYNLQGTVHIARNELDAARTSFTTALAKDPKFVAAALNLARVEEKASKPAEAENWYNKAIAIDSRNLTAYQGLAGLALMKRDLEKAASHLDKAIQINPKASQPRLRLVGLFLDRKENSRALIAARAFVNEMPEDPAAIDALGRAQIANSDFTNAVGSYQRLVNQLPNNAEAKRRLGRAYAAAGKKQEARGTFDQGLGDAPDFIALLTDRVMLEQELKGPDQGVVLAETYVKDRPQSVPRLLVLGDLQGAAQKNDIALATYRKAWEKQQNADTMQRVYVALNRLDRKDEALKFLQDWSAKNPNDYNARFMVTSHYISTGKLEEALKHAEALNGALPENPVLLNNLAWLYGTKKDPKAISIGERALVLAPQSPDIMDTVGWIHLNQGDASRSVELLGKASEIAPKSPEIAYHYAAALRKTGDTAKAKAVLSRALEVKQTFADRPKAEALFKELGG